MIRFWIFQYSLSLSFELSNPQKIKSDNCALIFNSYVYAHERPTQALNYLKMIKRKNVISTKNLFLICIILKCCLQFAWTIFIFWTSYAICISSGNQLVKITIKLNWTFTSNKYYMRSYADRNKVQYD